MRHCPSDETMQAPTGELGSQVRPKSGQSEGVARPSMIRPQRQPCASAAASGSATSEVSRSKRRRASRWAKAGSSSRLPSVTSAMPRQRPVRRRKTFQSACWAFWFPSRVTQRG